MDLFSSKKLLLGIAMGGMLVGQAQAGVFETFTNFQKPSNKVMGVAAAATFAVVNAALGCKAV